MDLTTLLGPGAAETPAPKGRTDGKSAAGAAGALFHGYLAGAIAREEPAPAEPAVAAAAVASAEEADDAQTAPVVLTEDAPGEAAPEAEPETAKPLPGGLDSPLASLNALAGGGLPVAQFTTTPLPDPLSDAPPVLPGFAAPPQEPSLSLPTALPGLSDPTSTLTQATRLVAEATAVPTLGAEAGAATAPAADARVAADLAAPATAGPEALESSATRPAALPTEPAPTLGAPREGQAPAQPSASAGEAAAAEGASPAATALGGASQPAAEDSPLSGLKVERRTASGGRRTAGTSASAGRGAEAARPQRTEAAVPLAAASSAGATSAGAGSATGEPAAATPAGASARDVDERAPAPMADTQPAPAREPQATTVGLAGPAKGMAPGQSEVASGPARTEGATLPLRELPERTLRVLSELRADGETRYRAELQLDPPALGRVRLEVELDGDGRRSLTRFTVETHAAREQLQAELPRLRALLAEQGLGDAQVELQLRQGGHQGQPEGDGQSRSWREGLRAEREAPVVTSTWRSGHDGLIDLRA